nr:uncharacterized protein LOC100275694 [Ipomoea batatas]
MGGIGPLIEAFERSKDSSFVRLVTETGKLPVNKLSARDKSFSFLNFPKKSGISPVRLLAERSNLMSCSRLTRVNGTLPVKLFEDRIKSKLLVNISLSRFGKSKTESGNFPYNPVLPRLKIRNDEDKFLGRTEEISMPDRSNSLN